MVSAKKKVFVALSGGVDSSISAALLLEAGFDCAGMFMITNEQAGNTRMDAETTARKLGIKLHILDLLIDFERIFDYFCSEYTKGRTPNPCVLCNRILNSKNCGISTGTMEPSCLPQATMQGSLNTMAKLAYTSMSGQLKTNLMFCR